MTVVTGSGDGNRFDSPRRNRSELITQLLSSISCFVVDVPLTTSIYTAHREWQLLKSARLKFQSWKGQARLTGL